MEDDEDEDDDEDKEDEDEEDAEDDDEKAEDDDADGASCRPSRRNSWRTWQRRRPTTDATLTRTSLGACRPASSPATEAAELAPLPPPPLLWWL